MTRIWMRMRLVFKGHQAAKGTRRELCIRWMRSLWGVKGGRRDTIFQCCLLLPNYYYYYLHKHLFLYLQVVEEEEQEEAGEI